MFTPSDPFIHLLAQAGFDPTHWQRQGWCHPNVTNLPYWSGRDPQIQYTSLTIPGRVDHGAVQLEEAAFLYGLVRVFKPCVIVETGANIGLSASAMALGLRDNGEGIICTCDLEAHWVDETKVRLGLVLPELRFAVSEERGVDLCARLAGPISLLFHDSLHSMANVLAEFNAARDAIPVGGLAIFHDWSVVWDPGTTQDEMRRTIDRIKTENPGWQGIFTPSSPGLYVLQRQQ